MLEGSSEAIFALLDRGFPLRKANFFLAASFIEHDDGSIMTKRQRMSGSLLVDASAVGKQPIHTAFERCAPNQPTIRLHHAIGSKAPNIKAISYTLIHYEY